MRGWVAAFAVVSVLVLSGCGSGEGTAGGPATPPTVGGQPGGSVPAVTPKPAAPAVGDLFHTTPNPAGGTPLCDASQAYYSRHGNGIQVQVNLHGVVDVSVEVDGKNGPLKATGFMIPEQMAGHLFTFPGIPFGDVTGVAVAASGDAGTGSCMASRV